MMLEFRKKHQVIQHRNGTCTAFPSSSLAALAFEQSLQAAPPGRQQGANESVVWRVS